MTRNATRNTILETENLEKRFPIRHGSFSGKTRQVRAVDGVSLTIHEGETLGVVGESGCGKTTLGRTVLRLIEPDGGKITFRGKDITALPEREMSKIRRHMQIIFQDPYSSLDPRFTVKRIIGEPLIVHKMASWNEVDDIAVNLLRRVGLTEDHLHRYPHEFSGGQRQRISIARALAMKPEFLVLDEPTSALDVSVQAQVMDLLMDLQDEYRLSYMFITHNLAVVRQACDRVAVMYLGNVVELGPNDAIFSDPLHPYTRALLSAALEPKAGGKKRRIALAGEIPSPSNPPSGCKFHTRCPEAQDACKTARPNLIEVSPGRKVACLKYS